MIAAHQPESGPRRRSVAVWTSASAKLRQGKFVGEVCCPLRAHFKNTPARLLCAPCPASRSRRIRAAFALHRISWSCLCLYMYAPRVRSIIQYPQQRGAAARTPARGRAHRRRRHCVACLCALFFILWVGSRSRVSTHKRRRLAYFGGRTDQCVTQGRDFGPTE